MREIKFRAWDRKQRVMFPVHLMQFNKISDELTFISGADIHDKDSDFHGDVTYGGNISKQTGNPLLPRYELMQYTGLKDRNGKEIYKGDIVSEHHGGLAFQEDYFQPQVVKWESFGFMPFLRVIGGAAHDYANNLKEYIVIGNIYENPQLLEEAAADA